MRDLACIIVSPLAVRVFLHWRYIRRVRLLGFMPWSPTHMDVQQEPCNYQSPFPSKPNLQYLLYEECISHQSEDKAPIPPKSIQKRTLSQSTALDEKTSHRPSIQLRSLPPLRSDEQSAASQDVSQRAPSPHSVAPPRLSTLPELRLSRPVGVKDLLNPTSGDKATVSGRQHDGERTVSQSTAPKAATSGPTTLSLPLTSMREQSLRAATIDASQSPFVLLRDQASASVELSPLLPTETPMAPSMPPAAPASSPPPRHTSPLLALPQAASTREPRSFFSNPSAFGEKGLNPPTSGTCGKVQHETITIKTEQSPIQVPVDVQAASKTTDEKRKRNATASTRFRKRRKEMEQEMSKKISDLEVQVREIAQEKECYRRERDLLQATVQQNRILLPPLAPSRRQKRYASLGGPQDQDMGASAPNGGRYTRRRISEYVPQQLQPPHTVKAPPPIPPFGSMTTMPSEHIGSTTKDAFPRPISS